MCNNTPRQSRKHRGISDRRFPLPPYDIDATHRLRKQGTGLEMPSYYYSLDQSRPRTGHRLPIQAPSPFPVSSSYPSRPTTPHMSNALSISLTASEPALHEHINVRSKRRTPVTREPPLPSFLLRPPSSAGSCSSTGLLSHQHSTANARTSPVPAPIRGVMKPALKNKPIHLGQNEPPALNVPDAGPIHIPTSHSSMPHSVITNRIHDEDRQSKPLRPILIKKDTPLSQSPTFASEIPKMLHATQPSPLPSSQSAIFPPAHPTHAVVQSIPATVSKHPSLEVIKPPPRKESIVGSFNHLPTELSSLPTGNQKFQRTHFHPGPSPPRWGSSAQRTRKKKNTEGVPKNPATSADDPPGSKVIAERRIVGNVVDLNSDERVASEIDGNSTNIRIETEFLVEATPMPMNSPGTLSSNPPYSSSSVMFNFDSASIFSTHEYEQFRPQFYRSSQRRRSISSPSPLSPSQIIFHSKSESRTSITSFIPPPPSYLPFSNTVPSSSKDDEGSNENWSQVISAGRRWVPPPVGRIQSWEGEWNLADMAEVQKQLRSLRLLR